MKLVALLVSIALSTLAAAAPARTGNHARGMLPTTMEAVDMVFPHSGIPGVASKLRGKLNLCMCGVYSMDMDRG